MSDSVFLQHGGYDFSIAVQATGKEWLRLDGMKLDWHAERMPDTPKLRWRIGAALIDMGNWLKRQGMRLLDDTLFSGVMGVR